MNANTKINKNRISYNLIDLAMEEIGKIKYNGGAMAIKHTNNKKPFFNSKNSTTRKTVARIAKNVAIIQIGNTKYGKTLNNPKARKRTKFILCLSIPLNRLHISSIVFFKKNFKFMIF